MDNRRNHSAYKELVNAWRKESFRRPPFVLREDSVLTEHKSKRYVCCIRGFKAYTKNKKFGYKNDKSLHLGLLPRPYSGSLARAKIFLLMLNPGLQPLDYYTEEKRFLRRSIIGDIHQKLRGKYPFPSLNPKMSWFGGAGYWRPKLRDHIVRLQEDNKCSYQQAASKLAKSICVLQLVPYHSPSFGLPSRIVKKLKSTELVQNFIREVIIPEAKRGKAVVVVTRKATRWGIQSSGNVIVYQGSESRAGYLSKGSRGGRAIQRFLRSN